MKSHICPTTFSFESSTKIRTVQIDNVPWFVATDVCTALQLSNPTMSLKALDEEERSKLNLGRQGNASIISESGLYTLILRCRDAVTPGSIPYRFRKWVTSEVLPQIRRTGRYIREELSPVDKAQQVVAGFMPAILEAMKQQEQKYSYPAKPGYREFIHSPEGVTGLAERSYLMNLLRELEENGNDVGGAMMEFTTMVNYITSSYRSIREIQTHAEFIVKQSKLH